MSIANAINSSVGDDVIEGTPRIPKISDVGDNVGQTVASLKAAIKSHLHAVALERDYDSPLSIVSYTDSKVIAWAAEAEIYTDWRDDVWTYAIEQLALFQEGYRELVSAEDFIKELPVIVWPE